MISAAICEGADTLAKDKSEILRSERKVGEMVEEVERQAESDRSNCGEKD